MSVEQYVFLNEDRLPSAAEVTAMAQNLGYDFAIIEPADLATHRGYLPVRLNETDTGFEAYFMSANQIDDLPPKAIQMWSHFVTTVTGGDPLEGMSATIYLRAVSEISGGSYWYPDDELKHSPDASLYLADEIASIKQMVERDAARAAKRRASQLGPEPEPTPPAQSLKKQSFFSKLFGDK